MGQPLTQASGPAPRWSRRPALPRHHSCTLCASTTNVDAGAAIHSLARSLFGIQQTVRAVSIVPLPLGATERLPLSLTPACSVNPLFTTATVESHSRRRKKRSTIRRRIDKRPISRLHIHCDAPVGHGSSAVTAAQALRVSDIRRSTQRRLLLCTQHPRSTPNAYAYGKASAPCRYPQSSAHYTKLLSPVAPSFCSTRGEQPACYHHSSRPHSLSNRNYSFLLDTQPNSCPSESSHSFDEQLDCRPKYR